MRASYWQGRHVRLLPLLVVGAAVGMFLTWPAGTQVRILPDHPGRGVWAWEAIAALVAVWSIGLLAPRMRTWERLAHPRLRRQATAWALVITVGAALVPLIMWQTLALVPERLLIVRPRLFVDRSFTDIVPVTLAVRSSLTAVFAGGVAMLTITALRTFWGSLTALLTILAIWHVQSLFPLTDFPLPATLSLTAAGVSSCVGMGLLGLLAWARGTGPSYDALMQ